MHEPARATFFFGAFCLPALGAVVTGLGACDGEPAHRVTLTRVDALVAGACTAPSDARTLQLEALGDFGRVGHSVTIRDDIDIGWFPLDTRAIEVRVLGAGGVTLNIGRTGTILLGDLADGSELPVFVAPPRSFCPVAPLARRRAHPVVVRAGRGALVLGGVTNLLGTVPAEGAELYNPDLARFESLDSVAPAGDLRGVAAITMADGRVVLVWDGALSIFDADSRTFTMIEPGGAIDSLHAYAQLASLPDGRVLIAGGCAVLDATRSLPCPASSDVQFFDPSSSGFTAGRALALARAGGTATLSVDGRVWFSGGFDATTSASGVAERWDAAGAASILAAAPSGATAALPAGGLLAAFSATGEPVVASAQVVPAFDGAGLAPVPSVARSGATVTLLDDGNVLALGGGDDIIPEAELFESGETFFFQLASAPIDSRRDHGVVRLDDGTVLVVGGRGSSGQPLADAWIYRHDLLGPWSSIEPQVFAQGPAQLVAGDPAGVRVDSNPPRLVLSEAWADQPVSNWLVLAGPVYKDVAIQAVLSTDQGVALLLDFSRARGHISVRLQPGEMARVVRFVPGQVEQELCVGALVKTSALQRNGAGHDIRVALRADHLTVTLDDSATPIVTCSGVGAERGAVGVGLLAASGGELTVDALIVSR